MTCRRIRKLIPLAAGDDLGPRWARAVRAHVDVCPACRRELDEFREAMARFKAAAREEGVPDWSEGEWKALMARATQGARGRREKKSALGANGLRPHWTSASALGLVVGLAVLFVLFRGPVRGPERTTTASRAGEADTERGQDVVAMTMVSQETGLQIVWFLDRNFDWKGD
jgi:hypothetical protein